MPERLQRDELAGKMKDWGLEFAGMGADLWSEKLVNTDDPRPYVTEFTKAADFCFWPNAWEATAECKKFLDRLNQKYG